MSVLLMIISFTWSMVQAGYIHPQVKKELEELQIIFGDLGIPQPDLTALATELSLKADEPDAEALLYNDFKRRLPNKELRAKFEEKIRLLRLYDEFVDRLVQAVGNENLAQFKNAKIVFGGELRTLEAHIRKLNENVKRGLSNKLFVQLWELLKEFEKSTTLSHLKSMKSNSTTNSNQKKTNMKVKSNLSYQRTSISNEDNSRIVINGKPWPKDSLHHFPTWLQSKYNKNAKMQPKLIEREETSTKVSAIETEYINNRRVTPNIARFKFYQLKIVSSSDESDVDSADEKDDEMIKPSEKVKKITWRTTSKQLKQKMNLKNTLENRVKIAKETQKQSEKEKGKPYKSTDIVSHGKRKIKAHLHQQTNKVPSNTEASFIDMSDENINEQPEFTEYPTSLNTMEPTLEKGNVDNSESELSTEKPTDDEMRIDGLAELASEEQDTSTIANFVPSELDVWNSMKKPMKTMQSRMNLNQTSEDEPKGTTIKTPSTENNSGNGEKQATNSNIDEEGLNSQRTSFTENAELLDSTPDDNIKSTKSESAQYSTVNTTTERDITIKEAEDVEHSSTTLISPLTVTPIFSETNKVDNVSQEGRTAVYKTETEVSATFASSFLSSSETPLQLGTNKEVSKNSAVTDEAKLQSLQTTVRAESSITEGHTSVAAILSSQSPPTADAEGTSSVEQITTLAITSSEFTVISKTPKITGELTTTNSVNEELAVSGASTNKNEQGIATTETDDGIEDISATGEDMAAVQFAEITQFETSTVNNHPTTALKSATIAEEKQENTSDSLLVDDLIIINQSSKVQEQLAQNYSSSTNEVMRSFESGESNEETQTNITTQNPNEYTPVEQLSDRPTSDSHLATIETTVAVDDSNTTTTTNNNNNNNDITTESNFTADGNINETGENHRASNGEKKFAEEAEIGSGEEEKA